MATATQSAVIPQERFVLDEVGWQTYERLLAERERAKRRYRITYDRGRLELMTISPLHGRIDALFARFFFVLSEELGVPIVDFGPVTLRREELDRGLEPDRFYYIQSEPLIRRRDDIDFDQDPVPDLAVEVDVSRSSLDRMGIYAALKIPEVWRYRDEKLQVYQLQGNGRYKKANKSRAFPFLDINRFADFLRQRTTLDELSLAHAFRAWVRSEVVPKAGNSPPPAT